MQKDLAPRRQARRRSRRGFTLVELVIAMVVIGILGKAAMNIYGGMQQDAIERNIITDLNGYRTQAERHKAQFNSYPTAVQATGAPTAATMTMVLSDGNVATISGVTTSGYTVQLAHPMLGGATGRTCSLAVTANTGSKPTCTGTVP